MGNKRKYICSNANKKIFLFTLYLLHWFFSHFLLYFFRDRKHSNAIDGSNIASSAFWKKKTKNFSDYSLFQQRKNALAKVSLNVIPYSLYFDAYPPTCQASKQQGRGTVAWRIVTSARNRSQTKCGSAIIIISPVDIVIQHIQSVT